MNELGPGHFFRGTSENVRPPRGLGLFPLLQRPSGIPGGPALTIEVIPLNTDPCRSQLVDVRRVNPLGGDVTYARKRFITFVGSAKQSVCSSPILMLTCFPRMSLCTCLQIQGFPDS